MVVTSGPLPPNPSELLGSARLGMLLGLLREKFDIIIFDCTPLLAVTDATVLATQVDGVILVIKSGATRRNIIQRGVRQLEDVQAKIVGAVLNQVNLQEQLLLLRPLLHPLLRRTGGPEERPAPGPGNKPGRLIFAGARLRLCFISDRTIIICLGARAGTIRESVASMHEDDEQQEQEIHLRDYLHVLQKRKWLVLAAVLISFTTAAIVTFRTRPLYQSAAKIIIERETPKILSIEQITQGATGAADYYNTQYKILQSDTLAAMVADRLRIWEHPEFAADLEKGSGVAAGKAGSAQENAARLEAAAEAILRRIVIEPVKNSFLVSVKARAFDPRLAALLANTLAETYIEQNLKLKIDTNEQADSFLGEQSAEARRKLAESERALQRFNEANNVISMEERQAGMTARLGQLNTELARARILRQDLENRNQKLQELRKKSGTGVPAGVEYYMAQFAENTVALRAELGALETDLAEQSKVYTPKHPKIVALVSKIQELRKKLTDEVNRAAQGLRNEYEIALKTEQSLESQISREEQALKSLNSKGLEHAVLKREVESNVRIYQLLAAREKETGVLSGIRTNNIRLVDRAKVPKTPFSPNRPRTLALGLLVGLVGGFGLVFFLEYLDDSVSDPDELARYVNVPFLGPVPLLEPKETGPLSRDLIALKERKSVYAEAYRTVRTSILFSSPDNPPRVFAVTSSGQQEGKTLTAVNLAVTMALNDKRVLLIDADMRKPRIHKIFGIENTFGLSSLIGGSPEVGRALNKTALPTLMVMPSGPVPPNPSELLSSARMGKFLGLLREKFDDHHPRHHPADRRHRRDGPRDAGRRRHSRDQVGGLAQENPQAGRQAAPGRPGEHHRRGAQPGERQEQFLLLRLLLRPLLRGEGGRGEGRAPRRREPRGRQTLVEKTQRLTRPMEEAQPTAPR